LGLGWKEKDKDGAEELQLLSDLPGVCAFGPKIANGRPNSERNEGRTQKGGNNFTKRGLYKGGRTRLGINFGMPFGGMGKT